MQSKYIIIKERLDEMGCTQRALAEHIGISPPTLWKTIFETRELQPNEIFKIAEFLGWDVASFARYVAHGGPKPAASGHDWADSIRLPYMQVDASAGKGVYADDGYTHSFMQVSTGNFAGRLPNAKTSAIIAVKGDSMFPALSDGDFIVVDTAKNIIEDGRIFVIDIGEERFVKRLYRNPIKKTITIKSDNPLHPEWDATEEQLSICGQVIAKVFCPV